MGLAWVVASGLVVFALSRWVFHEPVSPRQWVGIVLAVGAVARLEG